MKETPPDAPLPSLSVFQELWSAILGSISSSPQKPLSSSPHNPALPEVIVHDPDSSKPRDLDDPFLERKVQERVGEAIANAARNKAAP